MLFFLHLTQSATVKKSLLQKSEGIFPNKVLGEFCGGFFGGFISGLFLGKKRRKNPPKDPRQNSNRNLGASRPKSTLQGSGRDYWPTHSGQISGQFRGRFRKFRFEFRAFRPELRSAEGQISHQRMWCAFFFPDMTLWAITQAVPGYTSNTILLALSQVTLIHTNSHCTPHSKNLRESTFCVFNRKGNLLGLGVLLPFCAIFQENSTKIRLCYTQESQGGGSNVWSDCNHSSGTMRPSAAPLSWDPKTLQNQGKHKMPIDPVLPPNRELIWEKRPVARKWCTGFLVWASGARVRKKCFALVQPLFCTGANLFAPAQRLFPDSCPGGSKWVLHCFLAALAFLARLTPSRRPPGSQILSVPWWGLFVDRTSCTDGHWVSWPSCWATPILPSVPGLTPN